jgi:hypothetical protein
MITDNLSLGLSTAAEFIDMTSFLYLSDLMSWGTIGARTTELGATTKKYQGKVHLFVAEKTLPEGWNVEKSWALFVGDLVQFRLLFSHDNILSLDSLMSIGPALSEL